MNGSCFDPEDIGRVLDTPEDHPDRQHLRRCPRCSSLARAFQAFHGAAEAVPEGADLAHARAVLHRHIDTLLAKEVGDASAPSGPTGAVGRPPRRAARILSFRLLAAAAVLVIAVGVTLWRTRRPAHETTLRGTVPATATNSVELLEARRDTDSWTLSWSAVEGAETYTVQVFAASLEPLREFGPFAVTTCRVPLEELGGSAADTTFVWRVTALRGGDPIARSQYEFLP